MSFGTKDIKIKKICPVGDQGGAGSWGDIRSYKKLKVTIRYDT
jgi:hypothetical protein